MSNGGQRTNVLDNDFESIFVEGFSTPPHVRARRNASSQFERAIAMVQEALHVKTAAYEAVMGELNSCKEELFRTKHYMAEMSRAELDSGTLREEVERLIMAKCSLAKDKAELEREAQLLWLERELVCDQLQVDPEDGTGICGVLEERLREARQSEVLHSALQEAVAGRRRLQEELTALRAHHRKCRNLWQRQERMLVRVLQVQAQLSSRGVRGAHMAALASPMPIKRHAPAGVKIMTHPFPHLHSPSTLDALTFQQQQQQQQQAAGVPLMPPTPPASSPEGMSALDRAFEALEMGTTRLTPRRSPHTTPITRSLEDSPPPSHPSQRTPCAARALGPASLPAGAGGCLQEEDLQPRPSPAGVHSGAGEAGGVRGRSSWQDVDDAAESAGSCRADDAGQAAGSDSEAWLDAGSQELVAPQDCGGAAAACSS